jgi:hypothetical protein
MGVEDFGLRRSDPAAKSVPATEVGKSLAHFEAEEGDVIGGEIFRGVSAVAGERDDRNAPIAASHSGCELNELPLGSADAIDRGNEVGDVHQGLLRTIAWSIAVS